MPLSWNEIKSRALAFSREWADAASEDSEAKPFWIAFFEIFGITNKRVATFEHAVRKYGGGQGYVDLFWPGVLLVEQKSRGRDLDRAFDQALDYFPGIKERDLPRHIVVCDFARFRLYDLASPLPQAGEGPGVRGAAAPRAPAGGDGLYIEFALKDLHKHIRHFGFIAGYETQDIKPQNPVNIQAAERMGRLHDALKASGYEGHALEVLLVRLLFCLFADDTGIFQPSQALRTWIEERTREDGSDLGPLLARLFQVLNTPENTRSPALDEQLAAFPYVNGRLFEEPIPIADFDAALREALLDACALDWAAISPAIFGALFQSIMDRTARRNLGAHYTSEENILKLIKPLFLDALWAEFDKVKRNKNRLFEFHQKLRGLTFFDPACGCGNFLVIAYRELRLLELEILRASHEGPGSRLLDIHQAIQLDVDQFHGIEIEEFPAQIAQVALWLVDHQMNLRVGEEFGMYFARIPLKTSPKIVHGNALTLDWNAVLPAERCSYVMGNPPFIGAKFMNEAQRADARAVFDGIHNAGLLDFVAAWYVKAARYLHSLPSPASGRGAGGEGRDTVARADRGGHGDEGIGVMTRRPPAPLSADKLSFARQLRQTQTDAETLIWRMVRNRALKDAKFRRQHPVGRYILDFYCPEHRLAIELDGGQHNGCERDAQRDAWLAAQGISVLRFWNNQVLQETENVLQAIWQVLPEAELSPPPPLPPARAAWPRPSPPAPLPLAGEGGRMRAAFVSTNSITQGEQVGALWGWLLAQGIKIHFAHRTFSWSNEARGKAAVHCVIVGFGLGEVAEKIIYEYADIKGEPHALTAANINPYLVDAPDVVLTKRTKPISSCPEMKFGNQPIDGGFLLLSPEERALAVSSESMLQTYIRRYLGSEEFINGSERYCLWLENAPPELLRTSPFIRDRLRAVRDFRLNSQREATRELAATPSRFAFVSHAETPYLLVPSVSSERRDYIPIGFMPADAIASNLCLIVPNANLYHFGVLTSTMHMAWVRAVCGRLKSDYRYSAGIVYNNFPWPDALTRPAAALSQRERGLQDAIETAAQAVLDARALFPGAALADLYDPLTMPPALLKAHQKLDATVDKAYGKTGFKSDAERVAFLFERYQALTSLLPASPASRRKSSRWPLPPGGKHD
jgi:very-short-patch-repair endonuclease